MPPSLLQMPDVVMCLILKKSNFRSIQNLRKSCRDLRKRIDDISPDSDCATFRLKFFPDFLNFSIYFGRDFEEERFSNFYRKNEEKDFLKVAFRDARILLDSTNNPMDFFGLFLEQDCAPLPEFLEILEPYLKSRKTPLKVRDFTILVEEAEQVLKVLPYLEDPEVLNIHFSKFSKNLEVPINKIVHLDQWKTAKELYSSTFFKEVQPENLLHFKRVHLEMDVVSDEMVLKIRKAFLESPHMEHFQFKVEGCTADSELEKLYGPPFIYSFQNQKMWFFSVPDDSEHVVFIKFNSSFVVFERIDSDEVFAGAAVINE